MSSPWKKHVRHAIWVAALAVAFTGMNGNVWAQGQAQGQAQNQAPDDEDDIEEHALNADKRLLNAILGPLGLGATNGPDINYRERSPLVVPQGRDLPVPGKAARGGDWPVEPEVKEKRAAAALRKAGKDPDKRDPAKPISGTDEARQKGYNGDWMEAGKRKEEPGFFSMLLEGKLAGTWEEKGKFEGEPPRSSLVDPPSGYLTPSPAAPYGVTPRDGPVEKKEAPL